MASVGTVYIYSYDGSSLLLSEEADMLPTIWVNAYSLCSGTSDGRVVYTSDAPISGLAKTANGDVVCAVGNFYDANGVGDTYIYVKTASVSGIQAQIDRISTEVAEQADLMNQIATALEGKTGGGGGSELNLQYKQVMPGVFEQTIIPDDGYDGLSRVTVLGDADLMAENIKEHVEIFGVMGTYSEDDEYSLIHAVTFADMPEYFYEDFYGVDYPENFEVLCLRFVDVYGRVFEIDVPAGGNIAIHDFNGYGIGLTFDFTSGVFDVSAINYPLSLPNTESDCYEMLLLGKKRL